MYSFIYYPLSPNPSRVNGGRGEWWQALLTNAAWYETFTKLPGCAQCIVQAGQRATYTGERKGQQACD